MPVLLDRHATAVLVARCSGRATRLNIDAVVTAQIATLWHELFQNPRVHHDRRTVEHRGRVVTPIVSRLELHWHASIGAAVEDRAIGAALRHLPHNAHAAAIAVWSETHGTIGLQVKDGQAPAIAVRPEALRAVRLQLEDGHAATIIVLDLIVLAPDHWRIVVGGRHAAAIIIPHQSIFAHGNTLAMEGFLALGAAGAWRWGANTVAVAGRAILADRRALAIVSLAPLRATDMGWHTDAIAVARRSLRAGQWLALTAQVCIGAFRARGRHAVAVIVSRQALVAIGQAAAIHGHKAGQA